MEFIKSGIKPSLAEMRKLSEEVRGIIEDVRAHGDEAVARYQKKFDLCERGDFKLSRDEIERAYKAVSESCLEDLRSAAQNIRSFAEAQMESIHEISSFSPSPGISLGHKKIPVQSCCCYVPGGSYPLYSTALMLVIPAKAAGAPRVAACSPAVRGSREINPKTVAAMDIAGADEIYALGGAHAIAAFSYGTENIHPVDLIVGPGNRYVTEAKRQCFGQVGIDFIAGPSEVLIIADGSADPELIAADILAQSEHDRAAKGTLITTDRRFGETVIAGVSRQLKDLDTAEIAEASWTANGEVILAVDIAEAISIANERAPEHLELQTEDDISVSEKLYNYGSLFMGKYSAEVFGDYASGTNHTLPTARAARYTGGVWVGTFLKICTHQIIEEEAMQKLSPLVSRMATGEGLTAHSKAAMFRLRRQ